MTDGHDNLINSKCDKDPCSDCNGGTNPDNIMSKMILDLQHPMDIPDWMVPKEQLCLLEMLNMAVICSKPLTLKLMKIPKIFVGAMYLPFQI